MVSNADKRAIDFSAIDKPHKYKQGRCNITKKLWMGDEFLIEGPARKDTLFTMWEINLLTHTYEDFWGISLMNWFRSLQEDDVVSILNIQRYLQSMSEVDIKRRKEFRKKVTPRMTFQDVARKEMGRENRASLKKGTEYERYRNINRKRNKRHHYKVVKYRAHMEKIDVEEKIKRYVYLCFYYFY